ncbi:MAG: hypothetical protein U9Q99_01730 [Nanoarchaeota archaeon]|nr:hypothetical protein [Nanoarchaeota archaeon]
MAGIKIVEFKDKKGEVRYEIIKPWNFFREQKDPFIKYVGWTGKIFGEDKNEILRKEDYFKKRVFGLLVIKNPFLYDLDNLNQGNFSKNLENAFLDFKYYDNGNFYFIKSNSGNFKKKNMELKKRYKMHYI